MKYSTTAFLLLFLSTLSTAQPFPESQTDGKYYTVNGAKLWTVSFGKGDPIFFIAGGPGGAHYGLRSFDSLSTTNTLVYFDNFGRGKSDTATDVRQYSLERDIEDLEGLRKAMGYSTINVLGHSYGGLVAQGYAIKYPDHVKHLILANTFHSFVMWQENDDNSNHEIRTNYPEVWDTLMKIRERGAISSDPIHQEKYTARCLMAFYTRTTRRILSPGAENLIRIPSTRRCTTKWWVKTATLSSATISATLTSGKI